MKESVNKDIGTIQKQKPEKRKMTTERLLDNDRLAGKKNKLAQGKYCNLKR